MKKSNEKVHKKSVKSSESASQMKKSSGTVTKNTKYLYKSMGDNEAHIITS